MTTPGAVRSATSACWTVATVSPHAPAPSSPACDTEVSLCAMRDAAVRACRPFDVLLSPTAPIPAFPAELPCPTNDPALPFEHIAFTLPFNMSEQPAASINCGYTSGGLPIGLQIVGKRHDDLGVLQVAHAWERLRPAQRAWPEPPPR